MNADPQPCFGDTDSVMVNSNSINYEELGHSTEVSLINRSNINRVYFVGNSPDFFLFVIWPDTGYDFRIPDIRKPLD